MVDEPGPGVRADHETGDTEPVSLAVHGGRDHVVVEATPVVPREEDRGAVPVRAAHRGVDHAGDPCLPLPDRRRRVLAVPLVGDHPRYGRQRAGRGVGEVVPRGLDVAQLAVLPDRLEPGQRVPDVRRVGGLRGRCAEHLVVDAVGLPTLLHVVLPAHAGVVQEVREVGPRVGREVARVGPVPVARHVHRRPEVGMTARRNAALGAARRPSGDHVEVGGEAPRADALEHVVLQDEVLREGPVVRDLPRVVPADRVGTGVRAAGSRALGRGGVLRAVRVAPADRPGDEPVHPSAVEILVRGMRRMRAPAVPDTVVVERPDAVMSHGIGQADGGSSVHHGDAVGAGVRAEVGVERPVLLHHHDDVLDLVDPRGPRRAAAQRERERGERCEGDEGAGRWKEGGALAAVQHLTGDASADPRWFGPDRR